MVLLVVMVLVMVEVRWWVVVVKRGDIFVCNKLLTKVTQRL